MIAARITASKNMLTVIIKYDKYIIMKNQIFLNYLSYIIMVTAIKNIFSVIRKYDK